MSNHNEVWVIGTGPMSVEYEKVLTGLDVKSIFIGRGESSAKIFQQKTGITPIVGGLKDFLSQSPKAPSHAIISVGTEGLADQTLLLLNFGVKNILIEKPGSLYLEQLKEISALSKSLKNNVFIAYNRRFYKSVDEAKSIISNDGGLLSFSFEFTELSHIIKDLEKADGVKDNWVIDNSSHVIDLAFFIGGFPRDISTNVYRKLDWHSSGSIFIGNGLTKNNIPFSYHSNWESPGRWNIELMTQNYRLIFSPIEKLKIIKKGSFEIEDHICDYSIDEKYKAGIFKQTKAFLNNSFDEHCSIDTQLKNWLLYKKIGGYK